MDYRFERLPIGNLLCAVAGGIDACSYLLHGHVFAGLQTGNLILLGTEFEKMNLAKIARYSFSISMFLIGVVIIKLVQEIYRRHLTQPKIKIENLTIGYEIFWLLLAALLSGRIPDFTITGFLSLAASAQLQEFRLISGKPFTSLMMTGHLRKVADFGYTGFVHHQSSAARRSIHNLEMLVCFVAGAIVTGVISQWLLTWSLIAPVAFLILINATISLRSHNQ